jgi:AcrR family transcriptional regulator
MGRKPIEKDRADDPQLKETWIASLTSVYLQNGLLKFTMDEIANKLGISKATLYKYFSSKEEILDAVVLHKIKEIEVFEPFLGDDQITFSERYFEIIKTASIMLAEISPRFLSDARSKHPELWEKVRQFQDRALEVAEKFYQKGIDAGIMNNISPRLLALTDKMFIRSVSDAKFLEEYNISLKEAFDGYFAMKSKGIFIR